MFLVFVAMELYLKDKIQNMLTVERLLLICFMGQIYIVVIQNSTQLTQMLHLFYCEVTLDDTFFFLRIIQNKNLT